MLHLLTKIQMSFENMKVVNSIAPFNLTIYKDAYSTNGLTKAPLTGTCYLKGTRFRGVV